MRSPTAAKVLLIVLVFSKWPLATPTVHQESSQAGMPLSDAEYENFFRTLTVHQTLHAACLRRAKIGCEDPAVLALDRYENHGVIPHGWICSDFPDNTSFPNFCEFALYRCIMKKYDAKRVLCPDDEITEKSAIVQNNEVTPDGSEISSKELRFELHDTTPTITTTSTALSPEETSSEETSPTEISPVPLPTTTEHAHLLMLKKISSAINTTTELISQLLAAFTATTERSSDLPIMTTTTAESLTELTSTPATVTEPELHPAADASELLATLAELTDTTTIAPTESFPNLATTTEVFPESTSDTIESFFDSTTQTTTPSTTEPCIVDYPEPLSTSTTPALPADTTHASSSSPTTICSIFEDIASAKAATTSSLTTASPQTFAPSFLASLPFPSPQPNSTMRVLILSFLKDKSVNPGDMLGVNVSPQTGGGSVNILHQEEIQNPLLMSGLKSFFHQLLDKREQQLMNNVQNTMSEGQQKPQLLSRSLQLLNELNSRSNLKSRLQR